MKTQLAISLFSWLVFGIGTHAASAQDTAVRSGVPGDGIPDIYFAPFDMVTSTSMGAVSQPEGALWLDTDGTDVVAFLVGGTNLIPHCELCDGMELPGADALANTSTWSAGYSAGSTQWIKVSPLSGTGFQGVIGVGFVDGAGTVQAWPPDVPPFLDFPDAGRGFATDLDFCADRVFEGPSGGRWDALLATNDNGTFYTNVTGAAPACVPELAGRCGWLGGFLLIAVHQRRRRRTR